jgi:glycosyltransferase A (GT-A) superfamily protein (DUF2064 family)
MNAQLLVLAKEPRPGRVKTRLCPPCTPAQAAAVARAALEDTVAAAGAAAFVRRTLVIRGRYRPPEGWLVAPQRGLTLGQRVDCAFADTAADPLATVLIGMDTPQVTADLLDHCVRLLRGIDAVLGRAEDGGWWLLGLRDPSRAGLIRDIPTSRSDTGSLTLAALTAAGLTVAAAPTLRDVDTAEDAMAVAALAPMGGFAVAVRHHLPTDGRVPA